MRVQQWWGWRWAAGLGLGVCGVAIAASLGAVQAQTTLDQRVQDAMIDAINDEYQARAFYAAVIEKHGAVRPFPNIMQAETRHAERLHTLFEQYGLPIPPDTFAGQVTVPETLAEACAIGIEAEIANVQMYDEFLKFVEEPELRALFTQLRNVSENNHKPAFERCVHRLGG